MANYPTLRIKPLKERQNKLHLDVIKELAPSSNLPDAQFKKLEQVADCLHEARDNNRSRILMMGAHVIRSGVQKFIIDLMRNGFVDCIAMNGACVIHDYEFALIGGTTEDVSRYIRNGEFGMWRETGMINDIVNKAYNENPSAGFGESVGRDIAANGLKFADHSLLAQAHLLGIPVTVHVSIGCDIIHQHPNFDGAATGALSHNDFLTLARKIDHLDCGVIMNFGSAVTAPEVYLKALSMARNVAAQRGKHIQHFTTMVCDLHDLPEITSSEPPTNSPAYYFRPWKTMLVRTVADGGRSFYVRGRHEDTVPALWTAIMQGTHENT